ncbi:hypothetical protein [Winogradskyella endarachnes]|uniref:Uncharacterized protein n=1 Tax=Winogradskyella endarachnes TaxID=2681965 RepID=A0A6L6UGD7_9FLAO|nr:hypothetical protein [Winogradskyella endarachnes]MUU79867.1 hypothetical protein [Winogradskyella endarachnes]
MNAALLMSNFDLEYFFFKLPIYTKVDVTEDNWDDFLTLLNLGRGNTRDITIEGYNPFRKTNTTYSTWGCINESIDYYTKYGGVDKIQIKCKRFEDIINFFIYYDVRNQKVMKVGQFPSIADFHIFELKKYRKILSEEKLKEFSKGIGLAANGVGIGSFVYLRRIFENQIWESFEKNKTEIGIPENDFQIKRMDDKIAILSAHLPPFLVKNKSLYSIISLGIHELSEKDCLDYFDAIRLGIEIILDQKLEELKKVEKEKLGEIKIAELHRKISKPKK